MYLTDSGCNSYMCLLCNQVELSFLTHIRNQEIRVLSYYCTFQKYLFKGVSCEYNLDSKLLE